MGALPAPLSFREVEEMLERGVVVTYETIRRWCANFGQAYANQLRRRRSRPGDKWHLDEDAALASYRTLRNGGCMIGWWRVYGSVLDMVITCGL
ncbi:MAG: hypothetical protein ACRDTD_23440 [Pseudonocardiaceae bacterium]